MWYRILLLCLLGMTVASGLHAQRPTKDKEKARQWQSMENGPWGLQHRTGTTSCCTRNTRVQEIYWKWAGFQSGFRVRFKEHKSNVKRILPTRVTAERDTATEN